jgi:uncharacterized protein YdbL (DUF1318 family)
MNRGLVKGFAEGGPVGRSSSGDLARSSGSNDTGDINNNINISINIEDSQVTKENKSDSSDDKNDTNKSANQRAKALTDLIKDNVVKTIIEQKRPGGLLAKTG